MTDTQKLEKLRDILRDQIEWYKTNMEEQGGDYVYDELYDQFSELSRGAFMQIMQCLVSEEEGE